MAQFLEEQILVLALHTHEANMEILDYNNNIILVYIISTLAEIKMEFEI